MARIRLVEAMSPLHSFASPYVERLPLMGPVLLATLLERRGHDVAVYSENVTGSVLDDPAAFDDLCEADYVGVSVLTPSARRGYRIAEAVRARSGRPRIVFGGVHASFRPREALRYGDFVVVGEGESIIADIVEGRADPGILRGRPVQDLDALPLPDYDLIRGFSQAWASRGSKALYSFPIATSRGCPYRCRYCSVTAMFGRRVRTRSAERVIEDVRTLYERGYRRFFFYDDNFTADRRRVRRILDGLRDLPIAWDAQVRLDFHWRDPRRRSQCDRALLHAMRRAGGDILFVGYETIEDETARRWAKGYGGAGPLEERSAQDTHILHDAGFWIHGMFVVGPEHDARTVDRIVRFARRHRIETLQLSVLTPFPGTALFHDVKDRLLFTNFPDDWDLYDGMHALFAHTRMGIRRFQEKILAAYREFYRHAGLSLRCVARRFRGPGLMLDKLRHFVATLRAPGRLMRAWEREMERFLQRVAALEAGRAGPPSPSLPAPASPAAIRKASRH